MNSCCQSSCGDACGSGCASGSCAGTTPAGSLKPAQDPISRDKAPDYEEDLRSRRYSPETSPPRGRGTEEPANPPRDRDPLDNFNSPSSGTRDRSDSGTGSGRGSDMFDETLDPPVERSNQKPPMADPLEGKELDPVEADPGIRVDEKTFYDDTAEPGNTTLRGRDAVIARTSSLSEVIAPKRLASRSLPSVHRPVSQSSLADKSNNPKSEAPRPLRWISAPLADGHVQL
jgi:hypothetical protein